MDGDPNPASHWQNQNIGQLTQCKIQPEKVDAS